MIQWRVHPTNSHSLSLFIYFPHSPTGSAQQHTPSRTPLLWFVQCERAQMCQALLGTDGDSKGRSQHRWGTKDRGLPGPRPGQPGPGSAEGRREPTGPSEPALLFPDPVASGAGKLHISVYENKPLKQDWPKTRLLTNFPLNRHPRETSALARLPKTPCGYTAAPRRALWKSSNTGAGGRPACPK